MQKNKALEVSKANSIDQLIGGKGAESDEKTVKNLFRCRHRWALVSKTAIRGNHASIGTLFIQCCRRCGTFSASTFYWSFDKQKVTINARIRYLKRAEGLQTVELSLSANNSHNQEAPKEISPFKDY